MMNRNLWNVEGKFYAKNIKNQSPSNWYSEKIRTRIEKSEIFEI